MLRRHAERLAAHASAPWILWVLFLASAVNVFVIFLGGFIAPLRYAAHTARALGPDKDFRHRLIVPFASGLGNAFGAAVLYILAHQYGAAWTESRVGSASVLSNRVVRLMDAYGAIGVGVAAGSPGPLMQPAVVLAAQSQCSLLAVTLAVLCGRLARTTLQGEFFCQAAKVGIAATDDPASDSTQRSDISAVIGRYVRAIASWIWANSDHYIVLWILLVASAANVFVLILGRVIGPLRMAAHMSRLTYQGKPSTLWRRLSVPLALGLGNGIGAAAFHIMVQTYGKDSVERMFQGLSLEPGPRATAMLTQYGALAVGICSLAPGPVMQAVIVLAALGDCNAGFVGLFVTIGRMLRGIIVGESAGLALSSSLRIARSSAGTNNDQNETGKHD